MKKDYCKHKKIERFFCLKFKSYNKLNDFKSIARNTKITIFCVNKTFLIHNGKGFKKVLVKPNMVGFTFGTFCRTKKIFYNNN